MERDERIEVVTGQVAAACAPAKLCASALGSCVAVVLYDTECGAGGIAHVMLPSCESQPAGGDRLKYAAYAIEELLKQLLELGAAKENVIAKVVGGAMIIQDTVDVGAENQRAVARKLSQEGIPVLARCLGGNAERSAVLDTATGIVWYSEGGGIEKAL